MFQACTGLTVAPLLPATTLTDYCYSSMFSGCKNIKEAPSLPATTLAEGCYNAMFDGCMGLTAAPFLPAKTLVKDCYTYMFEGCNNLSSVICLAEQFDEKCVKFWLDDVSTTGTFKKAASANWGNHIPQGWNIINY